MDARHTRRPASLTLATLSPPNIYAFSLSPLVLAVARLRQFCPALATSNITITTTQRHTYA